MRGARLASDKISVETQGTSVPLFLNGPPPLPSLCGICLSCGSVGNVSHLGPRGAAVLGQTVHQGEWQIPGQKVAIHFSAPRWTSARGGFTPKTFNTFYHMREGCCKGSNQIDGLKQVPDPGQARKSAKWLILLCLISLESGTPHIMT